MLDQPVLRMFVPTVRPDLFHAFLTSLCAQRQLDAWKLYVAFQEYPQDVLEGIMAGPMGYRIAKAANFKQRRVVYEMRLDSMKMFGSPNTVWANLDDDMEFLPQTNYAPAVEKALEPDVGAVSCNWVISEKGLEKKIAGLAHAFEKQPIVNMAGGMIYKQECADHLIARRARFLLDDCQAALQLYVGGYNNYRYLGSLLIHRIMKAGGLKVLYAMKLGFVPPNPEWIKTTRSTVASEVAAGNNYNMPTSSDVLPLAHSMHKAAKLARAGARATASMGA